MKVGDKVKISANSEFYASDWDKNPQDVVGVITSLHGTGEPFGLPIDVLWPNFDSPNDYAESDLEVVDEDR